MTEDMDDSRKVSQYWGNELAYVGPHGWLEHPVARACMSIRVSGDPAVGVAEHWRRSFLPHPAPMALSLGCGFGGFERTALRAGIASYFDARDASVDAISRACVYAANEGLSEYVSYAVFDLNTVELPEERYDAIFGISSVHHIRELERLFDGCRRALKPGGLLFLDEYVGPSRFQLRPPAVGIINKLMRLLPERYRHSVYMGNKVRESYENPPLSWFEENDPSEAVRSDEIMQSLRKYFDVIDWRPYGGTILHMLLAGTAGNFDVNSDADVALLRTLAFLEEQLEEAGVLSSDFAAVVARPL